ncbi:MAG: hypothetical protein U5J64_11400 [Halobacteriales archaeon]|nr:hypothetical protein [Halobacteriales archaeon]
MKKLAFLKLGLKALVFLLGAVAVAVGLATFFVPGLADTFVIIRRLEVTLGNDYLLVAVIAGAALVLGLVFAFQGRAGTVQQAETPDAEGVESVPAPGDDFDELVSEASGWRSGKEKDAVRERVREAAVDVVASKENCSRPEAERYIDTGTWTADRYAAAFLGGSDAPKLPFVTRLQVAYGGSPFKTAATRAVEELYEISQGEENV